MKDSGFKLPGIDMNKWWQYSDAIDTDADKWID
jgi:hypothetical protein